MNEEQVRSALRALADQDRGLEAPPLVEQRVMQGFRKLHRQKRLKGAVLWSGALAASLVIAALWTMREAPQPAPAPAPIETAELEPPEPTFEQPAPRPRQRREVVTQFFPLTDSALPMDRGQILRVRVPVSTMRAVGLPVHPDHWQERVDADVFVGEEGIARAIRFVGYEQR